MKKAKVKRLRDGGWSVGDAKDFLGLTAAEAAIVEMKVSLARGLRTHRTARRLSQATLAARIGSSQSRVAKMEAGDPSVSLELLIRSLLATGTRKREIAQLIVA
jgi:DNA-binding XRE family transcriptional regulator